MSATALYDEQVDLRRERRPCTRSEGVTLGQLLARVHEAVLASGVADCPACAGRLGLRGTEARCADCGSRLA